MQVLQNNGGDRSFRDVFNVFALQVKIATKKTDYSTVSSRVGSTANMDHKPGGGEKKVSLARNTLVYLFHGERIQKYQYYLY